MQICVITHNQARQWVRTGNRPECEHHHHISFTKALAMLLSGNCYEIAGQRAIVPYSCLKYSWTGAPSGNFQVMQMKPIGK